MTTRLDDPLASQAPGSPLTVDASELVGLRVELRAAAEASCRLRTVRQAEAAGYFLASPYVDGVGTHWINWSLVTKAFDPARPAMLLFANIDGDTHLVGFSYWVRSATAPVGFAGPLDRWHRHSRLCFSAGEWAGEGPDRSACAGVWLNGTDLWMLHAWIVPGVENPAGVFAPAFRQLCRPHSVDAANCPRIVRATDAPPTITITPAAHHAKHLKR